MSVAPYVWLVDHDHLDNKDVSIAGPGTSVHYVEGESRESLAEKIKNHPEAKQFRMYDDDGELYYSGYYVGPGEEEFAPLDDFGTPNAGCTEIHYLEDGEWKQL